MSQHQKGGFVAFIKEKIGFKTIGFVVSAALISFAAYVLFKELRGVHWDQVWLYVTGMPVKALVYAFLCAAGAYLSLTAYDFFAVRTIGRDDIPYPTCAVASFTSYSIAHNLGATFFTGTVVRYLIYSRKGLTAVEVIKVSILCGLTFWLGNLCVLGLGFLLEPEVIEPILSGRGATSAFIRISGGIIIAALLLYVLLMSIKKWQIGTGQWAFTLPGGGSTLVQMLIGIIDLSFCAGVFYILLSYIPGAPMHPFTAVGVVFVGSMLLGFISHAPGAAGAFEATLLIALIPMGYDKETVIAALILFRIYYFIVPFVLALLLVFIREVVMGGGMDNIKASMAVIRQAEEAKKQETHHKNA